MRSVPAIEVPPNFITIRAKNTTPAIHVGDGADSSEWNRH
jgi:hypothetical protein